MIRITGRYFAIITLALLAGCKTYEHAGTIHGYHAYEDGTVRRYDAVSVIIDSGLPAPTSWFVFLTPEGTNWNGNSELAELVQKAPPSRTLLGTRHNLLSCVDEFMRGKTGPNATWIISLTPVVVARSTSLSEEEYVTLNAQRDRGHPYAGTDAQLVGDTELSQIVDTLYILPNANSDPRNAITLVLPKPQPISEVLETAPWRTK